MTAGTARDSFRARFLHLASELHMRPHDQLQHEARDLEAFVRQNGSKALSVIREIALTGPARGHENFHRHEVTWNWIKEHGPDIGDAAWRIGLLRDALRGSSATRYGMMGAVLGWQDGFGLSDLRHVILMVERHWPTERGYLRDEASDLLDTLWEDYVFDRLGRPDDLSLWLDAEYALLRENLDDVETWVDEWTRRGRRPISAWDTRARLWDAERIAVNLSCAEHEARGRWMIAVPKDYWVSKDGQGAANREISVVPTSPDSPAVRGLEDRHYAVRGNVSRVAAVIRRAVGECRYLKVKSRTIRHSFEMEYRDGRIIKERVICPELRQIMDAVDAGARPGVGLDATAAEDELPNPPPARSGG